MLNQDSHHIRLGPVLLSLLCTITIARASPAQPRQGGKLYWYDQQFEDIRRANLDGSAREVVFADLGAHQVQDFAIAPPHGDLYLASDKGTIVRARPGDALADLMVTNLIRSAYDIEIAQQKIYWYDLGFKDIRRANLDGSEVEVLLTGLPRYVDIELDLDRGKLYWVEELNAKILRANLDGTQIETLLTETDGLDKPTAIALDLTQQKIYWIDFGNGTIKRATFDGTDIEDLITDNIGRPEGADSIVLDTTAGKMYWSDISFSSIQRATLDGTEIEPLLDLSKGLDDPTSLELDAAEGLLYWVDVGTDKIQRSTLSGTDLEDLVTEGVIQTSTVTLDVENRKLYWDGTGSLMRADLDGTDPEVVLEATLLRPVRIAIAREKLFWVDAALHTIRSINRDGTNPNVVGAIGTIRQVNGPRAALALSEADSTVYVMDAHALVRMHFDGTERDTLVQTDLGYPADVEVDLVGGKVYWTDLHTIQRANLDGTDLETLPIDGLDSPTSLALDVETEKLYWVDIGTDKIQRANVDGSSLEDIITTGEPRWIALDGATGVVTEVALPPTIPVDLVLEQNYPNPFERQTTIRYTMAKAGAVDLQVYNVLGRLLFSQVVTRQEPGSHFVMVDAKDWPSGVYLYRLQVGTDVEARVMLLAK